MRESDEKRKEEKISISDKHSATSEMIEDGNKSNGKCIQSLNCVETSMIG